MAHSQIVAAFRARLADNWTNCPVLTDTNVTDDLPSMPFLQLMFPVSNAWQASVGAPSNNVWREEGGALLILNVERNSGADAWLPWIDELAQLFRGKNFDGVQTYAPTSAYYDDDNEEGQAFQLRLAVPFDFDLVG